MLDVDFAEVPLQITDTDLYHHYLQHTSRTLTYCQQDQVALQIGMPTLALQSKTVFHSLLALSAACLCCDMIKKEPSPDVNVVNQILTTAYRHYTLASEQMRGLVSQPDASKTESLLASTILLVPFATSSQQINHWIASKSVTKGSHKLLSTTPRDVIVMMRGVRTMLQALDCEDESPNVRIHRQTDFATDSSWLQEFSISIPRPPPSHTHMMFPIIAATVRGAFSKLQERLSFASLLNSDTSYDSPYSAPYANDSLSACSAAFEIVNSIVNNTFSSSKISESASPSNIDTPFEPEPSTSNIAPWLRSYASRTPIPQSTESLTKYFLTFLVQTPQEYLDLTLPLLDQRLENPIDTPLGDSAVELTREQSLALDIYAHWSVLMFLVEDESWWIGNLPIVTLTGMLNRYGDDFVIRSQPECGLGKEQWWPGSMLNILREIKRC
jgi:hypothetical protein